MVQVVKECPNWLVRLSRDCSHFTEILSIGIQNKSRTLRFSPFVDCCHSGICVSVIPLFSLPLFIRWMLHVIMFYDAELAYFIQCFQDIHRI